MQADPTPPIDFQQAVLSQLQEIRSEIQALKASDDQLRASVDKLTADVEASTRQTADFEQRFSFYQQSTQWVVQLAFALIASATITVIVSAVLGR